MTREKRPARAAWLRGLNVPKEWRFTQIKHLVRFSSGDTITAESIELEGPYAVYGANGLRGYTDRMTHTDARVLVGRVGALCGNVHLVDGNYWASEHALVGSVQTELTLGWLRYLLQTMDLGQYSQATAQPVIAAGRIESLGVEVPPLQEQRAIADYLDRETARIDILIEEQQRLIELLDERREGIVAAAVTRGLNSDVCLVNSGVPWLGCTPKGWSVKALRRCGSFLTGSTPSTDDRSNFADEANERAWVRPQDLSSETSASAWLTPEGWSQLRPVPAGSVLVGCIAYSLGSVGFLQVAATTNQQITSIIPTSEGKYLYYVMCAAKDELWAAKQINRVPILNNQRLGSIQVPVPPADEQRLIAKYLDDQTQTIDRTKLEAKRLIELSRERRSALITAAVTGQIDVRAAA